MTTEELRSTQVAIADLHKKTLAKLAALRPEDSDDVRATAVAFVGNTTGLLLGIRTGRELAIVLRTVGNMFIELSEKLGGICNGQRQRGDVREVLGQYIMQQQRKGRA